MNESEYARSVDELYPEYQPDGDLLSQITMCREMLSDPSLAVAEFVQTDKDLNDLLKEVAKQRAQHEQRDLQSKFVWLSQKEEYRSSLDAIEVAARFKTRLRDLTGGSSRNDSRPRIAHADRLQFKCPDDMRGIAWLVSYLVLKAGGITVETIQDFRSLRMGPKETPTQAAARAIRLALIIYDSGQRSFNPDHELRELFTTPDLKGGAFFTNTLFKHIEPMVLHQLESERVDGLTDPVRERDIWIEKAESRYKAIHGSGSQMDKEMARDHASRIDTNRQGMGVYKPMDRSKGKDSSNHAGGSESHGKSNADKASKDKSNDKGKGKGKGRADEPMCIFHPESQTHTTSECAQVRKLVDQHHAGDKPKRVATTTPAPGTDPTAKGSRPNAKYSQAGGSQGAAPTGGYSRPEAVVCKRCTDLVGRTVRHRADKCFMDPKVAIEEWFNPSDAARRKVVEEKRKKAGMGPLPPYQPRTMAALEDDTSHDGSEDSATMTKFKRVPRVNVVRAFSGFRQSTSPQPSTTVTRVSHPLDPDAARVMEIRGQLHFNGNSRSFVCRGCGTSCQNITDPSTGHLQQVHCSTCQPQRQWQAGDMPYEWRNPALWGNSIAHAGIDYSTPKRAPRVTITQKPPWQALYDNVPAPMRPDVFGSSKASNSAFAGDIAVSNPSRVLPSQTEIHQQMARYTAEPHPHDFVSPLDRKDFTSIMAEYRRGGHTTREQRLAEIMSTLSEEAQAAHTQRLRRVLGMWAAENGKTTDAPDVAPAPSVQPDVKPVIKQSDSMPTPSQAQSRQHAQPHKPPPSNHRRPVTPDGDSDQSDSPDGSWGRGHVSPLTPVPSLSEDRTPVTRIHGLTPVAQLVDLDQVLTSMTSTLSLEYIPRTEHEQALDKIEELSRELTKLKGKVDTVSNLASSRALSSPLPRVTSSANGQEDPAVALQMVKLGERISELETALARHPGCKCPAGLMKDLASTQDRLNELEANKGCKSCTCDPSIGSDVADALDRVKTLESNARVDEHDRQLHNQLHDSITSAHNSLSSQFSELKQQHGTSLSDLDQAVKDLQTGVIAATGDRKSIKNTITSVHQDILKAFRTYEKLKGSCASTAGDMLAAQRDLDTIKASIPKVSASSSVVSQSSEAVTQLGQLTNELSTLRDAIAPIQRQLTDLQSQVAQHTRSLEDEQREQLRMAVTVARQEGAITRMAKSAPVSPVSPVTVSVSDPASNALRQHVEQLVQSVGVMGSQTTHDLNYMWQCLKPLLDAHMPHWRTFTGYSDPVGGDPMELSAWPYFERALAGAPMVSHPADQTPAALQASPTSMLPMPPAHRGLQTLALSLGPVAQASQSMSLSMAQLAGPSSPGGSMAVASGQMADHGSPSVQFVANLTARIDDILSDTPQLPTIRTGRTPRARSPSPLASVRRVSPRVAGVAVEMTFAEAQERMDRALKMRGKAPKKLHVKSAPNTPRMLVVKVDGVPEPGAELVATLAEYDQRVQEGFGHVASGSGTHEPLSTHRSLARHLRQGFEPGPNSGYESGDDSVVSYATLPHVPRPNPEDYDAICRALAATADTPKSTGAVPEWPRLRKDQDMPLTSIRHRSSSAEPLSRSGPSPTPREAHAAKPDTPKPSSQPNAQSTPVATSADDGDVSEQPATQAAERTKLRNQSAKGRKTKRKAVAHDLPVIDGKLCPTMPQGLLPHFKGGEYMPSTTQLKEQERFFDRRPALASLKQTDEVTALHIFGPNQTYCTPARVLIDTGAEIKVMISPHIARKLGLTWTPKSTKLVGIGGQGGGDGYTHQRAIFRLGGVTSDNVDRKPFEGCFSISLSPLVMQANTVDDIGFEVLLGQGFLRPCLGNIDYLTETLDYSPAWVSHACPEFRCSVPCKISSAPSAAKMLWARLLHGTDEHHEHEPLSKLLVGTHRVQARDAKRPVPTTDRTVAGTTGVSTSSDAKPKRKNKRKAKKVRIVSPTTTSSDSSDSGVVVGAIQPHPGFPQEGIPSRAEHQAHKQAQTDRRRHDRAVSDQAAVEARARQSEKLAHVVAPIGICYNLRDLQSSARLMDGFKLDLSPGTMLSESQLSSIAARLTDAQLDAIAARVMPKVGGPSTTGHNTGGAGPRAPPPPSPAPVIESHTVQTTTPPGQTTVEGGRRGSDSDSPPPAAIRRVEVARQSNKPGVSDIWMRMKGTPYPRVAVSKVANPKRMPATAKQHAEAPATGRKSLTLGMARVMRKGVTVGTFAAVLQSIPGVNATSNLSQSDHALDMAQYIFGVCIATMLAFMVFRLRPAIGSRVPARLGQAVTIAVCVVAAYILEYTMQFWTYARHMDAAQYLLALVLAIPTAMYFIHSAVAIVQSTKAKRS